MAKVAGLPMCSRCGGVSVYNPCRGCATPEELRRTFQGTSQKKPITLPYYPELPERYL